MNKRLLFPLIIGLAAVFIGVFIALGGGAAAIDSFEDCVKAGYPVMESLPRKCATPDGRIFIEGAASSSSVAPVTDTVPVKVFFASDKAPQGEECTFMVDANRPVPRASDVPRKAVEELLKGPSSSETANGLRTSIPAGTTVQSLTILNGTATVDFSKELENYGGGSCNVQSIRTQIEETLRQFDTVQNVEISIDGRTEDILQP